MKRLLLGAVVLLFAGCDDLAAPAPGGEPEALPCNPLVGDDCVTPFPSSFHEVRDPSTRTGMRVSIPMSVMPANNAGVQINPARLNAKDGFSPSTPFLVYFEKGVDASQLPTYENPTSSLLATSPVQVIDMATSERVLVFAELDANSLFYDRQALIIRPLNRLRPGGRYAVVLIGLKDKTGLPLNAPGFAKLRDKQDLTGALVPLADRYEDIFLALGKAGVTRPSVTLAWDVVIASDQTATGHLIKMRDTALSMADSGALTYTVDKVIETPNHPHRLREIQLTVKAPSYLTSGAGDATMTFGPDGEPALNGLIDFPMTIEIPQCAKNASKSLPFVVLGHGIFGTARETLNLNVLLQYTNELCMVMIGTDWIGLSTPDLVTLANVILPDFNNLWIVTDRLQQSHVNQQVMTRLFRKTIKNDASMKVGNRAVTDGNEAYFLGASLGGIEGTTYMALSTDIVRGILNVPGCNWNLMMFRSFAFDAVKQVMGVIYKDKLDQQLLIAGSQSEWDYTDGINFAGHLLRDPLPGSPIKRIIVQESIGDALVPNMATRMLVRAIGLPGMNLEQPVLGVTELPPPLDSAYTQWDIKPAYVPDNSNVPPARDNGAHTGIQEIPQLIDQIVLFLHPDGKAELTCPGLCVFPR